MFTADALLIGAFAAILVGVSKTALPGSGLLSVPLIAAVVDGRQIAGASLPILIAADLFAVRWYRHHTRWDLLRPLAPFVAVGFATGIGFYVAAGDDLGTIDVTIGTIVLVMVAIQAVRLLRRRPPHAATARTAAAFGTAGGFATFVSNSAGPVVNTYLVGLGLDKHEQVGTSAWLYFLLNVAKVPFFVALGLFSDGGAFFTVESLLWDATLLPALVVGVYGGRSLFGRIPQRAFTIAVLVLSAAGGLRLVT